MTGPFEYLQTQPVTNVGLRGSRMVERAAPDRGERRSGAWPRSRVGWKWTEGMDASSLHSLAANPATSILFLPSSSST